LEKRHNKRIETPNDGHITPPVSFGKRGTTLGSITPFSGGAGPHIKNAPGLLGAGRHEWDSRLPKPHDHLEAVRFPPVFLHLSSSLLIVTTSRHAS
jgi:hypothetical protein